MAITLTVAEGPNQGMAFTFEAHDTFLVGRSPQAHFVLPENDPYFSRLHFLVEVNPPLCRLMDMKSRNGTYVNGAKVHAADLHDGDWIQAGHTTLRVALQPAVAEMPQTMTQPAPAGDTLAELAAQAQQLTGQSLLGLLQADQERRWQSGTGLPAEVYLQQMSGLQDDAELAIDLIYHEVLLREGRGEKPLLPEYQQRFPQFAEPLRRQFDVHQALEELELARPARRVAETQLAPEALFSPEPARRREPAARRERTGWPTIAGYTILKELGRGGMGVVYQAGRQADGTLVALKTILPAVKPSEAILARFLREACILKQLDHPHIIAFRDLGFSGDRLFFAMDFVPGIDADQLLRQHGPLPIPRAVRLVCQVLDALAYAHNKGFIHRDVKPANLLVVREPGSEMAKLADFGLARTYQASSLSGLTVTGASGGTPAFMPPEQVRDFRSAQPAADQYAAAATLYRLLTGQPLFDGVQSTPDLLTVILHKEPVPVRSRRPEVPAALAEAIERGLARQPEQRFADVQGLRQALLPFGLG